MGLSRNLLLILEMGILDFVVGGGRCLGDFGRVSVFLNLFCRCSLFVGISGGFFFRFCR